MTRDQKVKFAQQLFITTEKTMQELGCPQRNVYLLATECADDTLSPDTSSLVQITIEQAVHRMESAVEYMKMEGVK